MHVTLKQIAVDRENFLKLFVRPRVSKFESTMSASFIVAAGLVATCCVLIIAIILLKIKRHRQPDVNAPQIDGVAAVRRGGLAGRAARLRRRPQGLQASVETASDEEDEDNESEDENQVGIGHDCLCPSPKEFEFAMGFCSLVYITVTSSEMWDPIISLFLD